MSKINEFAKDIIIGAFKLAFEYWYLIALIFSVVYCISFLCRLKLFRNISYKFKRKSILGKAVIVIIIIIIIAFILN